MNDAMNGRMVAGQTSTLLYTLSCQYISCSRHISHRRCRRQLVCRQLSASRKTNSLLLEAVVVDEGLEVTWWPLPACSVESVESVVECARAGTLRMHCGELRNVPGIESGSLSVCVEQMLGGCHWEWYLRRESWGSRAMRSDPGSL